MRAIVFLVGGLLFTFGFIFCAKHYLITPKNMFFFTVEVKGKKHEEVVKELVRKLNEKGLKVIRTLPMSEVLHARGVKDFPNYTTVLACDVPQKKEILLKVPFMNVLLPCSVAVYERGGKVYITSFKETLIVKDYSEELGYEYSQKIEEIYQRLRIAMAEVAKGK